MSDVTSVILEVSSRATQRWQTAIGKIRTSKYGLNEWLSDTVGFWVDDVGGSVMAASRSSATILLTVGTGETTKDSQLLAVPNPEQTRITDLVAVGSSNKRIPIDPPADTCIVIGTPSSPSPHTTQPGTVRITLRHLNTLNPPLQQREQYTGILYEDEKLLAQVVLLVN